MNQDELPYHRWPRSYGGWQAGSIIRCEGAGCQWCNARWKLVDNETLQDVEKQMSARPITELHDLLPDDCALVAKADGKLQFYLPNIEQDQQMTRMQTFLGAVLVLSGNQEFVDETIARFMKSRS